MAKRKETLDPWKVLEISKAELDAFGGKLRLDRFLANSFPHLSRSRIQELVAGGGVLVDDKKAKASHSLAGGETVKIDFGQLPVREMTLEPRPLAEPLEILFEDDQIIVVNKPAGVTVHPGAGTQDEITLVHAVLHHCGNLPLPMADASAVESGDEEGDATGGDEQELRLRPGIVHRLDRDTTGAMVIAKTAAAHANLAAQFHDKTNARQYLALCQGTMPAEAVVRESWLGRDPAHRTRFRSFDEEGPGRRYAKTIFRREKEFAAGFTLVSARLYTGRTHQIRVHAQDLGMPVCGDTSYGQPGRLSEAMRQQVTRQLLHAWRLGLKHPQTGHWLEFEAPLPTDFAGFLRFLRDLK